MLQGIDDWTKANLAFTWRSWIARPAQVAPEGDWLYWLILAGRGFGKTRSGAEWVREQARDHPRVGLIGKDAADMRSVMIEGESGILACCPPWERPEYLPSRRLLRWPNGALSELRTGEDPEGIRGVQFDRVWADEIAAWMYPQETWDQTLLALRLGTDPRACITTTPKPIRVIRDLVRDPHCAVTRGTTFDNLANLAAPFRTIISRYEGTRLGRQELYAELLEDEGLAYRFQEHVHVVPAFRIPESFERFEHMDYGWSQPSAWYVQAVDHDGNLILFDGLYEAGLPSELAPKIHALRNGGWEARDARGQRIPNTCWADPNTWGTAAITSRFGGRASAATEFITDGDISIAKANNDRRAGYIRIAELLKRDDRRVFPDWHPMAGQTGSPRLFFFDVPGTLQLREQIADAPIEDETEPWPGEAVSRKWEQSAHGHASLRYGVLSRPSPSERPEEIPDDPRVDFLNRAMEHREVREDTVYVG